MQTFRRNMLSPSSGLILLFLHPYPAPSPEPVWRPPIGSDPFSHTPCLWLVPFLQPSFFKPYISPPPPSFVTSALKIEAVCYSETLDSTYETTWRQNQDNTNITLTAARTSNLIYSRNIYGVNMNIHRARGKKCLPPIGHEPEKLDERGIYMSVSSSQQKSRKSRKSVK
jgi:hypothetical protein